MKIAFIAGLSDKKLLQKLIPLATLDYVERIDVFRRMKSAEKLPEKVCLITVPSFLRWNRFSGEIVRISQILLFGYRYDIFIGCFQQWHGVWAWLAGKVWRKPVIQLVITDPEWNMKRYWCRKAMLSAEGCGVRGEHAAAKLADYGYKGRVEIIHNPLAANESRITHHASRITKYHLISVADFAEEKDFSWMLKVLKEVKKRIPDIKIALCGSGLKENLLKAVTEYDLLDNIEFPGHLNGDDLTEVYRSSSCFLSTSKVEGLPQAAIEALSFGIPCILTDTGECSSLIRDGIEGMVIRHGDTDGMSDAIFATLSDSAKFAAMKKSAEERFKEIKSSFSIDSIADKWWKLFRD
jgi:glycosyltransferase involved in cell wall biosynthesis